MELKECDLAFIRKCRVLCDDFPMELPGIKTLSACYQHFINSFAINVLLQVDSAIKVFKEHAQDIHRWWFYVEFLQELNYSIMNANFQHFINHIDDPEYPAEWTEDPMIGLCPIYAMIAIRDIMDLKKYPAQILELARPHCLDDPDHLENVSAVFVKWFNQNYEKKSYINLSTHNILARVGNIFDGR